MMWLVRGPYTLKQILLLSANFVVYRCQSHHCCCGFFINRKVLVINLLFIRFIEIISSDLNVINAIYIVEAL